MCFYTFKRLLLMKYLLFLPSFLTIHDSPVWNDLLCFNLTGPKKKENFFRVGGGVETKKKRKEKKLRITYYICDE